MNPADLMIGLATFLAADQELQNWCLQEFGKRLKILLGVDEDNPPVEDDYPLCGITDVIEKRGDTPRMQTFTVYVSCGLLNAAIETPLENLFIYSGLPQVADLKHRIESACLRYRPGGGSVSGDSVPVSLYPLFVGYTTLDYQLPQTTRRAAR